MMDARTNKNRAHQETPEKAYKSEGFLDSRDARPVRILAEYLEPEARFARLDVQDTIVFFGSARFTSMKSATAALESARSNGAEVAKAEMALQMARYYEEARELARRLSEWSQSLDGNQGHFVVCTGGGPGIMEAANRGAREANSKNIGLTISIPADEFQNNYITSELAFEFHYFFMRKFWFTYMAKAVVVMPGGFGTLDELFELMTLIQTLKMKKRPPIVLFGRSFWDEVLNLDALVRFGTIDAEDLDLFYKTDSVDEAYEYITTELVAHAMDSAGPSL